MNVLHGVLCLAICGLGYSDHCSPGCKNDSCYSFGQCEYGCKIGYFGFRCNQSCDLGYDNEPCCPQNCKNCLSGTECTVCKDGWYGDMCRMYCPDYCLSGHCHFIDGSCCNQGHTGAMCDQCLLGWYNRYGLCRKCPVLCYDCLSDKACQSMCPAGCKGKTHTCGNTTAKCTEGCIDGLWGEYCNSRCPSSCTQCLSDNYCNSCLAGYYGRACQLNCSSGCAGSCDIHTGECTACKKGYYGTKCDQTCLSNCVECDIGGICSVCRAGFYGSSCKQTCPVKCNNCTGIDSCGKCKDGFHGIDCSNNCPTNCATCISSKVCNLCKDGFTSAICESKCNAKCQSCLILDSNVCTKCARGRYGTDWTRNSSSCSYNCSRNCFSGFCDGRSGHCFGGCVDGYAGDQCSCPENCQNACYTITGRCYKCNGGYSGESCSCITDTHTCNKLMCESCRNNTWYSNDSDNTCCKCSGTCRYNQCKDANTCSNDCLNGFYGTGCQKRCSQRDISCLTCTTDGCSQCVGGFYPANDSKTCVPCSEYCVNGSCSAKDGMCLEGCKIGFWGELCDESCDARCKVCDRSTGVCNSCEYGLFTSNCSNKCNQNCRKSVTDTVCDIDTGQCTLGCMNDTIHGKFCEVQCNKTCSHQVCNWKTGKCSKGCILNRFGEWCQHHCSDTCIGSVGDRKCNEVNGSCNFGCKDGYFDFRCNKECNRNCVNRTCERLNGMCTSGCTGGYDGYSCDNALKPSQSNNTGAIVGAVTGVCVSIVMIVVVVFNIIKRRRKGTLHANGRNSTTQETNTAMDVIKPDYKYIPASA